MNEYIVYIYIYSNTIMVNLAQQVEHRSVDSKDLVQVQSFTLLLIHI
mgnify:CR=1 FL=1